MRSPSILVVLFLLVAIPALSQSAQSAPPVTIACRALDVHADSDLKVAVIVFHQRDPAQQAELAPLLRNDSGQMVEIQGDDGGWRKARMLRLKSCFGRGLLMLATPSPVGEHAQFLLRVPGGAAAR